MSQSKLYEAFPVRIGLNRESVTSGRWQEDRWVLAEVAPQGQLAQGDYDQRFDTELRLFADERKHLRYNLESERPVVFVICDQDEIDGTIEPRLVTLSQDEAVSYMEAEALVLSMPLPDEIQSWAVGALHQMEAPHG